MIDTLTHKEITQFRNKPLNRVITVDPGKNLAVAIWTGTKEPGIEYHINCGFEKTVDIMFDILNCDEVLDKGFTHCVIEGIDFRSAATAKHLPELAYKIGGLCDTLHECCIIPMVIQARTWKGTMNDQQVAARVKRLTGKDYTTKRGALNSHITDAVGMGLYLTGEFTDDNENTIDWEE